MAMSSVAPLSCRPSIYPFQSLRPSSSGTFALVLFLSQWNAKSFCFCPLAVGTHRTRVAYSGGKDSIDAESMKSCLLDDSLLRRILSAKDAHQVIEMIAEAMADVSGGTLDNADCRLIIKVALDGGNVDLALSVFDAMHSGRDQGMNEMTTLERWRWARPDVQTYALLVRGLAACLRVKEALRIIGLVSGAGIASADAMPFGMVVQCPICMLAIAVAQPQHGIQVALCSKCRYQYELVSGDVHLIDSEATRICYYGTQHGYFSLGKGFQVPTTKKRNQPCFCPLYCGAHTFWNSSHQ